MNDKPTPEEPVQLKCEVCLEEIPSTVSQNQEANEYAQHFCGIECYSVWKQQQQTKQPAEQS